jgi:hypothetical protein
MQPNSYIPGNEDKEGNPHREGKDAAVGKNNL